MGSEVAKWLAVSREGEQRSWTLRLAHGITDFLLDYAGQIQTPPLAVSFENVDMAEPLDQEFLAVLLRRADPERLLIKICSSGEDLSDALCSAIKTYAHATHLESAKLTASAGIPKDWASWLMESSAGWVGEWLALSDLSQYFDLYANHPPECTLNEFLAATVERMSPTELRALANTYLDSNCTSDRLFARRAYMAFPDEERRLLHLAQAKKLDVLKRDSLSLGAIPFHYEQASVDAAPLLAASNRCMHLAFYDAALGLALRGRGIIGSDQLDDYGAFTRNILFSLLLLGRYEEVETVCAENLATSRDPLLLARVSYAKAILNARLYEALQRNYEAARIWAEKALAFMAMLPTSQDNAAHIAFLRNTLALVESRTGRLTVAHQMMSDALDYLAKDAPVGHEAERTILLHNRARLHVAMKEPAKAIADLTTLLQCQPGDFSAYFDRAVLHQRAGCYEEALRDYNAAIRWSPPYAEFHFNRAQTFNSLGRNHDAMTDYDRVLTLDPNHVAALSDRARLFFDQRNLPAARRDAELASSLSPDSPRLLCLLGLLDIKEGQLDQAFELFTRAIRVNASLPDAWANRATVLFMRGDLALAAADLTQALGLHQDANTFYNRGRVFEAQSKWTEAFEDYSRALALAGEDVQHILAHRDRCGLRATKKASPASSAV